MSDKIDINQFKNQLTAKYKNVNIHDVVDNKDGSYSIVMGGTKDVIEDIVKSTSNQSYDDLPVWDTKSLRMNRRYESASTITRDKIGEGYLDMMTKPSILNASPQELYQRSMDYYRRDDIYGTVINMMTNFASKGFKNDIDDNDIRNFYDNWGADVGLDKVVEQMLLEFFRSGLVRTYKVIGKYEPKINYISPIPGQKVKKLNVDTSSKEFAAKKIKWSKTNIPVKYTILNPTQIEIDKSSILIDQQLVILKSAAFKDLKKILETNQADLTEHQKLILKSLPPEFKRAAIDGKDLLLDPYRVGSVDYRRQPYELYPLPFGVRAFESLEYKRKLRESDYSTLDGIINYMLVITIGNDLLPVKSSTQLENVAELFNTPSKAFNVVWDHTLKVQRISPQDVGDVLGQEKYAQANEDITGALGVIRALVDGVGGATPASADLAVKALVEEIYYARREVARWLYAEYRDVAEGMGFDRFPKIRFDNMILKDELLMMNVIQGLIDRRIISYKTGHEMLGFDFGTLISELEYERDKVLDGTLGVIGSPYNPKASPFLSSPATPENVQQTQKTPKGTPSEGRPKSKPAKKPAPKDKTKDNKVKSQFEQSNIVDSLNQLSVEELEELNDIIAHALINKVEEQ